MPIIALTASALRGDKEKCFAAGMNDFLLKPLNVSELLSRMKQYLPSLADGQRSSKSLGDDQGRDHINDRVSEADETELP